MNELTITINKRSAVRVAFLILWSTLVALLRDDLVTFVVGDDS